MGGKQTAVDYLFEMWLQDNTITQSALEQARRIDKEQKMEAYAVGFKDEYFEPEEYYNETYNSDPE